MRHKYHRFSSTSYEFFMEKIRKRSLFVERGTKRVTNEFQFDTKNNCKISIWFVKFLIYLSVSLISNLEISSGLVSDRGGSFC